MHVDDIGADPIQEVLGMGHKDQDALETVKPKSQSGRSQVRVGHKRLHGETLLALTLEPLVNLSAPEASAASRDTGNSASLSKGAPEPFSSKTAQGNGVGWAQ